MWPESLLILSIDTCRSINISWTLLPTFEGFSCRHISPLFFFFLKKNQKHLIANPIIYFLWIIWEEIKETKEGIKLLNGVQEQRTVKGGSLGKLFNIYILIKPKITVPFFWQIAIWPQKGAWIFKVSMINYDHDSCT